jgi:hypothetical protein
MDSMNADTDAHSHHTQSDGNDDCKDHPDLDDGGGDSGGDTPRAKRESDFGRSLVVL